MVPHGQMFMFSFSSTTLIVNFLNTRTGNAFARIYWFANLVIMDSITGNQGGGERDEVWDRETMFSQLAKRSPCVVVSG